MIGVYILLRRVGPEWRSDGEESAASVMWIQDLDPGRPIRGQGCGAPTNEQRRGGDIISWGSGVYRCTERGGAPGVCTEFTLDTLPLSSLPPLAQLYLMKSVKSYKALEGGETIQSSQNTAPILWKTLSIRMSRHSSLDPMSADMKSYYGSVCSWDRVAGLCWALQTEDPAPPGQPALARWLWVHTLAAASSYHSMEGGGSSGYHISHYHQQ